MKGNRWKGLVLTGGLLVVGGISTTPVPERACAFVQQFHKLSQTERQVGVWERVVYSLIEASQPAKNRRAPNTTTSVGA